MNRALSMISLATKAGKTKSGEFMTEKRSQGRTRASGDCGRRRIGQYKKEISEHV